MKTHNATLATLLVSLFLASCGEGGGGGDSTTKAKDSNQNQETETYVFVPPRIVAVADTKVGSLRLAWTSAADKAHGDIDYQVFFSSQPSALSSGTEKASTVNQTETVVNNLEGGKTYYIAVVAKDKNGAQKNSDEISHISVSVATKLVNGQDVISGQEVAAQPPQRPNDTTLVFANEGKKNPEINDVVVGQDAQGKSFLRKVVQVDESGDSTTLQTESVVLENITTSFGISSTTVLVEPESNNSGTNVQSQSTSSAQPNEWQSSGGMVTGSQQNFIPYRPLSKGLRSRLNSAFDTSKKDNSGPSTQSVISRGGVELQGPTHILMRRGAKSTSQYTVILQKELGDDPVLEFEKKPDSSLSLEITKIGKGKFLLSGNPPKVSGSKSGQSVYEVSLLASSGAGQLFSVKSKVIIDVVKDKVGYDLEVNKNFSFDLLLDFDPRLETNIEFEGTTLTKGQVTATVQMSVAAIANYNFTASANYEKDFTIFKRSFLTTYSAGPIPVYQRTTLTLRAKVTAGANASIDATAVTRAASEISFGLKYNRNTGKFESLDREPQFEKSITIDIVGQAGAHAELRLIPEVEVSFYEVATGQLAFQPYINGNIEAAALVDISLLNNKQDDIAHYQLNQFDINLGFDVYAGVNINLFLASFDVYPYKNIFNRNEKLFSLPDLNLQVDYQPPNNGMVQICMTGAVTKQGENNIFSPESSRFSVIPSDGIALERHQDSTDVRFKECFKVSETQAQDTEWTGYFSGYGQGPLGYLGRRYVSTAIRYGADEDKDGMPDYWEKKYAVGGDHLSFHATGDGDRDLLTNLAEYKNSTNPTLWDTDRDCIPDGWEVENSLNPNLGSDGSNDPDGDELSNLGEFRAQKQLQSCQNLSGGVTPVFYAITLPVSSDPQKSDTDGDGLPDGWEEKYSLAFVGSSGLSGNNGRDGDPDGDGLSNYEEYTASGNPKKADTDDDGMPDKWEVENQLRIDHNDAADDKDHDQVSNLEEYRNGTNPRILDIDFAATIISTGIQLSWSGLDSAKKYEISRTPAFTGGGIISQTTAGYPDADVQRGSTYSYGLSATFDENQRQIDGSTLIVEVRVNAQGVSLLYENTPPDPATTFSATPSNTQVTLTWKNPTTAFDKVVLLHKAGSAVTGPEDSSAQVIYQGTAQTHSDSSLTNGTEYHYALYTYTSAGGYSSAATASATPISLSPPATIGASGVNEAINLNWSKVDGATGYNIYYAQQTFSSLADIRNYAPLTGGTTLPNQTGTSRTITGLTNGTTYYFVVTAIKTSEESQPSNEVTAVPQVLQTSALNDTGIDWGGDYTSGNNSTCSSNISAPQDCDQGRDSTHNDDSDGHAGFDFTKLSASGTALAASATSWSCVRDNVTGLVWEVKVATGSADSTTNIQAKISNNIHHKDNLYRWGGTSAIGRDHGSAEGTYYDDWNTLVTGSNDASLCGYSDWRAPKIEELGSIADYSRVNPSIDSNYFPNTANAGFWSASPDADHSGYAWHVRFDNGYDDYDNRDDTRRLRLVRGGQ